jgi:putative transcriptional regulator
MVPLLNALPEKLSPQDVANIRHMHHLTQKELADGLGVSKRTVEAWETGRNNVTGAASKLLCLLRQGDVAIL